MASGNKFFFIMLVFAGLASGVFAQEAKEPSVAGTFYPEGRQQLSEMLDRLLDTATPVAVGGDIFALISPHAGYGYSGQVAAYGYSLIKGMPYQTVVIIGTGHQFAFSGVSVYSKGAFLTPLGVVQIDEGLANKLIGKSKGVFFDKRAFAREHSVEVQIPFLQKTLPLGFKIVPIVIGDCSFDVCRQLAVLLKDAIGQRKDVLVVVSTDMYHGYNYREANVIDKRTIDCIEKGDAQGLYYGLREGKYQLCGGLGVVTALLLSRESGYNDITLLRHFNSGDVTGIKKEGTWTVGYSSFVLYKGKEVGMLDSGQRKRLLEIARNSLQEYLKTGKRMTLKEDDPLLKKELGAFVTLHERGQLRGCIGNIVGRQPLYLTIRDMAIEAGVGDPRFSPLKSDELKDIEIEISVLTPLERVESADKIQMGIHGVMVKKGFNSGVFLPQVATETGWSREEFLSYLCQHKAGISPDAWKDKSTELYVFTAEVFQEKDN